MATLCSSTCQQSGGSGLCDTASPSVYNDGTSDYYACSSCPANKYVDIIDTNGATCVACLPGQYADAGNTSPLCTACTFELSCKTCVDENTCSTCPANKYMVTEAPTVSCVACNPGYYSLDGNTATACTACTANLQCATCTDGSTCATCPAGRHLFTSGGTTSCSSCAQGTFSLAGNSGTTCTSCTTGCSSCTNSNTCQTCSASYYLSGSSCLSCAQGTYSLAGNADASCTQCPIGCTACTDPNTCSSCTSDYELTGTSCVMTPAALAALEASQGLSGGAIAGVVIGVIIGVVILGFLGFKLFTKLNKSKALLTKSQKIRAKHSSGINDNTPLEAQNNPYNDEPNLDTPKL